MNTADNFKQVIAFCLGVSLKKGTPPIRRWFYISGNFDENSIAGLISVIDVLFHSQIKGNAERRDAGDKSVPSFFLVKPIRIKTTPPEIAVPTVFFDVQNVESSIHQLLLDSIAIAINQHARL